MQKWQEDQSTGVARLKDIASDEAGQKATLGPDYERIAEILKPISPRTVRSTPAQTSAASGPSSSQASTSTSKPMNGPRKHLKTMSTSGSRLASTQASSSNTPRTVLKPRVPSVGTLRKAPVAPLANAPPKKKPKFAYDPNEVIDLTSD